MELGTEETYVIVADEDEVSAMLETANSNLIKGEFNPVKYGEFLNTLLKKMPLEQLAATLPTPQVQIEALTQLVSDLPKLKPEDMIPVAGQQKWVIKLEFGDETEYQEAEDGINQIAKILGTTSNSATLLHLIRGYAG